MSSLIYDTAKLAMPFRLPLRYRLVQPLLRIILSPLSLSSQLPLWFNKAIAAWNDQHIDLKSILGEGQTQEIDIMFKRLTRL